MEENDTKGFKISFNDDDLGPPPIEYNEEREGSGRASSEKQFRQQITAVTVVISLVMMAVMVFFFFHLNTKIIDLQNAGTTQVESLKKISEESIKELTDQTDQLKARIQSEIDQLDVKIKSVSGSLGKNQNSLDKSVSEKAGKKDLEKTEAAIAKKIEEINRAIKNFSADLKTVDTEVNNQLKQQTSSFSQKMESLSQDMAALSQEFSELSRNSVDQGKLQFELDLQAKRYKTEMKQAINDLEKKLAETRKKEEAGRKATVLPGRQVIAPPPTLAIPVKPKSEGEKMDGILEKDLSD
ncbi:MAG: hypothetical protein C4522_07900 [Desulfobacteraceae bacterium]|nr:MAG: hypothetical protein C4522_07900 [Desulfobacteraceae bacterium]